MLSPVLFQCVQSAWLDWRNNEDEEKVLYYSAVVKMSRSTPAHSPQGNTWTEMSWAKRKRKYLNEKENHHTWKPSLFWSQPTGIVYLFIYSCWFCWTRCCVPSKINFKYSIFNNIYNLVYKYVLNAQVYYSFVLWESRGKKTDLQKSHRMKSVQVSPFHVEWFSLSSLCYICTQHTM